MWREPGKLISRAHKAAAKNYQYSGLCYSLQNYGAGMHCFKTNGVEIDHVAEEAEPIDP
jgi:hypothetical protein